MRKCLRCGTEMKENCTIKVEGGGYGILWGDGALLLHTGIDEQGSPLHVQNHGPGLVCGGWQQL